MPAKIIAYTKPVSPEYGATINEFIAFVARVSNPANQWNHETASKLVDYLKRNKHFSPLEMADIVIEIETTRDIARQLLRHRSFSFQEFSFRYQIAPGFADPKEARLQDDKNRQNSIETDDVRKQEWWINAQERVIGVAQDVYRDAIKIGLAKEVARVVLPEGLTMSRLYMKGSVRSWLHYLEVRLDKTTQKEHRALAQEIADCIQVVMEG